jgi:BCD family chlorophyll transporter-like MFS transporter
MTGPASLGWFGIARLGLVQSALGAIVMLATSLLNRVMVVEYALAAAIPAGLVAWHYAVQLSRPHWGHGSDKGRRRTPWIIGGMGLLAMGGILATNATLMATASPRLAFLLALVAYTMIGAGVGASGTSLLALLATRTAPERRPAAAAITWIMMIFGIVVTAAVAGSLIDPFSPHRLALVAGGVALAAFLLALVAVAGIEGPSTAPAEHGSVAPALPFRQAIAEILSDPASRIFTLFVFVAMLAYSMQDMILEPFAGLVFGLTPGGSTKLSSVQHMGVLIGMLLVGIGGSAFAKAKPGRMQLWVVAGCIGSAAALALLGFAARSGPGFPLSQTVFALGFANGVFAVSAIGTMMELAGAGKAGREGIRMGLWGASQAIAFGLGGFLGAVGVDIGRRLLRSDSEAFMTVFAVEAGIFLLAAAIAVRMITAGAPATRQTQTATLDQEVPA